MIFNVASVIAALAGWLAFMTVIWLLIAAFRVSLLWGLACLFIPFAQIFFVFTHWEKAAKPLFTGLFAAILFFSAIGIIAINADQIQTEQFLRIFQMRHGSKSNQVVESVFRFVKDHTKSFQKRSGDVSSQKNLEEPQPFSQDLFSAVRTGELAAVQKRLLAGDDVNMLSAIGETPLMEAAACGYGEIVRYLIAQGADPMLKNQEGQTARDIAEENHRSGIVLFLEHVQSSEPVSEVAPV